MPLLSGLSARSLPGLRAFAIAVALVGCGSGPEPRAWELRWEVRVEEHFTDPQADSLVELPVRLEGEESWLVSAEALLIQSEGVLSRRQRGSARTWILVDEGWVVTEDLVDGTVRRSSLARWNEERLRQTRLFLIGAYRARAESLQPNRFRGYLGGGEERELENGDIVFSAVPSRLWRLRGRALRQAAWSAPLLPLALEGVSLETFDEVGEVLARRRPKLIEEISLGSGATTLLVRHRLRSVGSANPDGLFEGFPDEAMAELDALEEGWTEFWVLWRYWEEPARRPRHLDARALRFRLEEVATELDVPVIRERIRTTESVQEMEELFHLLYSIEPQICHDWYVSAVEARSLPEVLSLVSVFSLRDRTGLDTRIRLLLEDTPELWEGRARREREEARSWLEAVRLWASRLPAVGAE